MRLNRVKVTSNPQYRYFFVGRCSQDVWLSERILDQILLMSIVVESRMFDGEWMNSKHMEDMEEYNICENVIPKIPSCK